MRRHRRRRRARRADRRASGSRQSARGARAGQGRGATHLGAATIDVLGYAPERVESPAAASAASRRKPDHPYARAGADGVGEALAWFRAESPAGRCPLHYTAVLEREHPAADAPSACRKPVGARAGDDGGGRPAPRRADAHRRLPRAQGLPPRAARRQPAPRAGVHGARRSSWTSRSRPRRRQRAGPRARVRPPGRSARGWSPSSRSRLRSGERVGVPGRARAARRAHGLERAPGPPRAARVRDPDAAALGARACASYRILTRRAARAPAAA